MVKKNNEKTYYQLPKRLKLCLITQKELKWEKSKAYDQSYLSPLFGENYL